MCFFREKAQNFCSFQKNKEQRTNFRFFRVRDIFVLYKLQNPVSPKEVIVHLVGLLPCFGGDFFILVAYKSTYKFYRS